MTREQMVTEMSYAELVAWNALDEIRKSEHDKAKREAQKGMRPRGR